MGKHLEKLKTGDPNRKVSNQEFMNVLGEAIQESTEILRKANKNLEPTMKRLKDSTKPTPSLKQRIKKLLNKTNRKG